MNHATYSKFKETTFKGRYVVNEQVGDFLETLNSDFKVEIVGYSVEQRLIRAVTMGTGTQKVLMWSQMHGNESTTTKAILDLLKLLQSDNPLAVSILKNCTLKIIPILNPDGAEAYTRVNANEVDLNRDAQERSQPESKVLRDVYESYQPDFCFNMHDQRTIFNVGNSSNPATISFLAPSHDAERTISNSRAISMQLIAAMNTELQELIPGQIGRYDDGFNANCVGDTFQMLNTPTVLFEAGHFPEDYEREKTREYIFYALLKALLCIGENEINSYPQQDYFAIPENKKLFFDVIIKNAHIIDSSYTKDIAILYAEVLEEQKIIFQARIQKAGCTEGYFGHSTYDCANENDFSALKKQSFWNVLQS
ncbi:M14 metallopeptidase family protein [Maribacter algarum]|nr:M14 metallopeptidase family protein [Maribacter algarum]